MAIGWNPGTLVNLLFKPTFSLFNRPLFRVVIISDIIQIGFDPPHTAILDQHHQLLNTLKLQPAADSSRSSLPWEVSPLSPSYAVLFAWTCLFLYWRHLYRNSMFIRCWANIPGPSGTLRTTQRHIPRCCEVSSSLCQSSANYVTPGTVRLTRLPKWSFWNVFKLVFWAETSRNRNISITLNFCCCHGYLHHFNFGKSFPWHNAPQGF